MERMQLAEALAAWQGLLGEDRVVLDHKTLSLASTATFATTARVAALLRPNSTAQVQGCLRIASAHGIAVHPVSQGRNWGLGSRVPPTDRSVLLDLGSMCRILDFDETLAYITVEPGVTFRQVSTFLRARGSGLFCAVIGGAADASLVGNAVERGDGIGPYGRRADYAAAMEVVLATGDVLETGHGRWAGAQATPIHRAGVGPGLDGLFLQSNLGVITRMTFFLAPRPAFLQVLRFALAGPQELARALEALRDLAQRGVLGEAGFTFWNKYKLMASEGQYPWAATDGRTPLGLSDLSEPLWQATGAQYAASRELGHAARSLIIQALAPFAAVAVFDTESHGALLEESVFLGVPSDGNLASAYWRKRLPVPRGGHHLDDDGCGVLFICPVLPLRGVLVAALLMQIEALVLSFGFEPNLGMHMVEGRSLLAYIAIMFDRSLDGEDARAQACHDAVLARLIADGHYPFRLASLAMGQLPAPKDATGAVLASIKAVLDPAQVLSPGRYEFPR